MKPLKEKGDCETCTESINVVLYELHAMKMCAACYTNDTDATAKAIEANGFIQASREIDTAIEIKLDVFKAETVAAQDVMASILADENIPAKDKNYAMAGESLKRYQHMREVIFAEKQEFAAKMHEKETRMRAWQVQVHAFAAKVEGAEKEKFRNFDINYTPKSVKTVKSPTPSSVTRKKPTKTELFDAAKKYGVPMDAVAMVAAARGMTADQAANKISDDKRIASEKIQSVN